MIIHADDSTSEITDNDSSSEKSSNEGDESYCVSDDSSEEEENEHVEKGWTNEFWRQILRRAYDDMKDFPDQIDKMKWDEYYSAFIENLQKYYKAHKFLEKALRASRLEDKLINTQEYYEREVNCGEKEAAEVAWDSRKFLFRKLIDKNPDLFQNEIDKRVSDATDSASTIGRLILVRERLPNVCPFQLSYA